VLGAVATLVKGHGPGSVLGLFIVAGTLVAALAVRPGAVRMLLPVPALCYVLAAITTGLIADPPSDASKAALAVAAAQWIAAGFLTMVLATALAVVLTAVRWFLWHRSRRALSGPGRSGRPGSRRKGRASREDLEDSEPYRPYETAAGFGNQGATAAYGYQGGPASPGLGDIGGLPGPGPYGDTGGPGARGPYTGGPGGPGPYEDTGGLGSQGPYGDTVRPAPLRRAGRWGDPGAPDPGGPVSWPEALQLLQRRVAQH
jgi:hypothetical protein